MRGLLAALRDSLDPVLDRLREQQARRGTLCERRSGADEEARLELSTDDVLVSGVKG